MFTAHELRQSRRTKRRILPLHDGASPSFESPQHPPHVIGNGRPCSRMNLKIMSTQSWPVSRPASMSSLYAEQMDRLRVSPNGSIPSMGAFQTNVPSFGALPIAAPNAGFPMSADHLPAIASKAPVSRTGPRRVHRPVPGLLYLCPQTDTRDPHTRFRGYAPPRVRRFYGRAAWRRRPWQITQSLRCRLSRARPPS